MATSRLPGTPRLLRALNDRAALELLLSRGPLTRAQLGEMTGLSKVTASQLVERLEERGLVRRVEQSTKDTDDPVGVVHNAVVQAAARAGTDMGSVRRVVLGTPGLVDPKTGDIAFAWDLPRWHRG